MQIKQIQVAPDPLQDRLLLRISTNSNEEVRVFLTRRFLRELWPHLMKMLGGHLGINQPSLGARENPPSGHFDQPFQNDNPNFPLGSTPLLPAEVRIEPAGPGVCKLIFSELKERSFTLSLNADLMQALCAMLRASSGQSNWDLALDYGAGAPGAPGTPGDAHEGSGKATLH